MGDVQDALRAAANLANGRPPPFWIGDTAENSLPPAEPWLIPNMDDFAAIQSRVLDGPPAGDVQAAAFDRDEKTLGRRWITPGTPGLMHRIGGLEKDIRTGHISYESDNHQKMTELRANKVAAVAEFIPDQTVEIVTTEWTGEFSPP